MTKIPNVDALLLRATTTVTGKPGLDAGARVLPGDAGARIRPRASGTP